MFNQDDGNVWSEPVADESKDVGEDGVERAGANYRYGDDAILTMVNTSTVEPEATHMAVDAIARKNRGTRAKAGASVMKLLHAVYIEGAH